MTYAYNTLLVENIGDFVFHVQLNRPKQLNSLSLDFWEYASLFTAFI